MLRLAVLCLLATSAFARVTPHQLLIEFHGRIIGGTNADPGEFPSQLSLQTPNSHNCGASVISANWALTAAHCVAGSSPSSVVLLSGTTALNSGGTRHQASRIIMHAQYNPADSWRNDIAVIEVALAFEFGDMVQPISLPMQGQTTETGAPATVIGWGRLSQGGPLPNDLQKVDIEISDPVMCNDVYNSIGNDVYDTHICADTPAGGIGSCNGDSGGPLFVDGTVVGLVSWALGCATPGYPTVYTRVSSYRDWITQNTGV